MKIDRRGHGVLTPRLLSVNAGRVVQFDATLPRIGEGRDGAENPARIFSRRRAGCRTPGRGGTPTRSASFRKLYGGSAGAVEHELGLDPYSGVALIPEGGTG